MRNRVLLIAALSLLALAAIFLIVDPRALLHSFKNADYPLVALGTALYGAATVLRSMRLGDMLTKSGPALRLPRLVQISSAHQVSFIIMPFGTGDLLFGYIQKWLGGGGIVSGVVRIAAMRISDLIVLTAAFLSFLVMMIWGRNPVLFGFLFCALTVLMGALMPLALSLSRRCASALQQRQENLPRRLVRPVAWIDAMLERAELYIDRREIALAVLTWLFIAGAILAIVTSVGIEIGFHAALFIAAALNFVGIFAKATPGGIGIQDLSLYGIMIFLGLSGENLGADSVVARQLMLFAGIFSNLLLFSILGLFLGKVRET